MTSNHHPLRWGIVLGLLYGCHPVKPEMSVEGLPQACCSVADSRLEHFKGCRIPRRKCNSRQGEKFWMRGAVSCGPVDEAACEGGRCCTYQPLYDDDISDPIDNWAPPGFDEPTNNVTDPDAKPQHDLPAPGSQTTPVEPPEPEPDHAEDAAESADGTESLVDERPPAEEPPASRL